MLLKNWNRRLNQIGLYGHVSSVEVGLHIVGLGATLFVDNTHDLSVLQAAAASAAPQLGSDRYMVPLADGRTAFILIERGVYRGKLWIYGPEFMLTARGITAILVAGE